MPADRVAILEHAFREAAKTEKFRKFLTSQSISAEGTGAQEMRKTIDDEYAAMGRIVKKLGLHKQ